MVVCYNFELLHCTFARFCLCAYFDKFSFEIFINGPSGCDNMDAWKTKRHFCSFTKGITVMIQFSTQGGFLLLVTQGGRGGGGHLFKTGHLFGTGCLFLFWETNKCSKQNFNIYFKRNNNRNCNSKQIYSECSLNLREFESISKPIALTVSLLHQYLK